MSSSYKNLELLIIDGQSQDSSIEIARSYPEVRLVDQSGSGIFTAMNQGVELAHGDFIAFNASDDLWYKEKLRLQMDMMLADEAIEITITKSRMFLESGYNIPQGLRTDLLDKELSSPLMETMVARKSVFERVGPFNQEYWVAGDVDWFARATDLGVHVQLVPQVLLDRRVHDANNSINAPANNAQLLTLLRRSIRRKASGPEEQG